MHESGRLTRRDPDAAALLSAQTGRGQRDVLGEGAGYDPLDLYVRLGRVFGWRDRDMDDMDYVRFFGYVDRLSRQIEREQAERDARTRGGPGIGDVGQVSAAFPALRGYEGRVAAYG